MPYATYYWYDGWLDPWDGEQSRTVNPIWIAYVETDAQARSRIAAKNVLVHYSHAVELSDTYAISDSTANIIRSHPLIENFMGTAIAIWMEDTEASRALWWSRFVGDAWSMPEVIIEDPFILEPPVFITDDAEDLESQDSSFNRLFWVSGRSIRSMMLDEQLLWSNPDTVHTSIFPMGRLMARRDAENDLWLLFDEGDRPDSVTVRAMVHHDGTETWSGPISLVRVAGEASQASLNLQFWDWEEHEMLLSWVDNNAYHDTIIAVSGGLVTFRDSWYGPLPGSDLRLAANTLLMPGTCIITTYPHVCYSTMVDSTCQLVWLSSEYGPWVLTTMDRTLERLVMSGLSNWHFLCCWSESDGGQSDINAVCCFIQVGSADEHPGATSQVELLSCGPNPTAGRTTVRYRMPRAGNVLVGLYDHGGRMVHGFDAGAQASGEHAIGIDMNDLAEGVYCCRVGSSSGRAVQRIVLVR